MTGPTEHTPVFSGPESRDAAAALTRDTGVRRPGLLVVLVCVLGLLVTALSSVAARRRGGALTRVASVVGQVMVGRQLRLTYAHGDRASGLVVYAERAVPADRRATVDRDSAYADLDYAIYLGRTTDTGRMTTTDVDPDSLPLTGVTSSTTIPIGDSVLTIVTSPREHLGSKLGKWLPLALLLGGLLLTTIATYVARKLLVARQRAEHDTATITALYELVDTLYGEQRDLSLRLQHSLLPQANPHIPGIDAVAEMARARFTLRAYLVEGQSPQEALARSSRQFDVADDGHIVTALVGVGNRRTGEIAVANAGHPLPVLATGGRTELVAMPVGPPLGVGPTTYQPASFTMPVDGALICYTDGLVERRDEDIDTGTRRLVDQVASVADRPLAALINHLVDAVRDASAADDVAVLAMRKTDA